MNDIKEELKLFYEPVEMPGGWQSDQAERLKLIDLYYNSQYETGEIDEETKEKKFFFNICKAPCDVASKFIDLDTKDIRLIPEKDEELKVWMMQKRLKYWMKKENFGSLLNEITHNLPKYGSVVVKKSKDGLNLVPLQNLRFDPSVKKLTESVVYEVHYMTKAQIESMGWNDKENIQLLFDRGEEGKYLIYECYYPEGKRFKRRFVGDVFARQTQSGQALRGTEAWLNDGRAEDLPELELHSDSVKKLPYYELHWEHVPGRWLGKGYVELLLENQIATNEAENLERKGLKYTSLHLLQTNDEAFKGHNVLNDTTNGEVLTPQDPLSPVPMEERNLAAFNTTRGRWDGNTQGNTFTFPAGTGENLPSRTPLGSHQLSVGMVSSFYDLKRENYGLFIKELLYDVIIPSFKKANKKEHIIIFSSSDDELSLVEKATVKAMVNEAVYDYAMKSGFFPSELQKQDLEARIREKYDEKKHIPYKVPANYYEDVRPVVDIVVTGESLDLGVKSAFYQQLTATLQSNPQAFNDPRTLKAMKILSALQGVNPVEWEGIEDVPASPMPLQPGGSAPSVTPTPQLAPNQQAI